MGTSLGRPVKFGAGMADCQGAYAFCSGFIGTKTLTGVRSPDKVISVKRLGCACGGWI